jgi:sulfate transport system ATP-binding protein
MNKGQVEQSGSPQEVWDHPASPFVYGFLGDVNLFHGRADRGHVKFEGVSLAAPEHATVQDQPAFAYVRPHDLDIQPYFPDAVGEAHGGILATLERAIVVGPTARLELAPTQPQSGGGNESLSIIEAQLPAEQYRALGLSEGQTVLVTPKRARVFVDDKR